MAGNIFRQGVGGVLQDFAEAVKWFRIAAEKGNAKSQLTYDPMEGFVWLTLGVRSLDDQLQQTANDHPSTEAGREQSERHATLREATARLRDQCRNALTREQIVAAEKRMALIGTNVSIANS